LTGPRLGLGIITYNSKRHIDRCLESVLAAVAQIPGGAEIVVVDNASPDETGTYTAERWTSQGIRVICRPDNAGYAAGVNTIARNVGDGDTLAILNPDLELQPNALQVALTYLDENPQVGLLGGNLLNPQGKSELVYGALPSPFSLWFAFSGLRRIYINPEWDLGRGIDARRTTPFEVGYPCGALWLLRREAWRQVGPFDERYFLYFEETDWATRCHKTPWKIMVHPGVLAMHEGGGSSTRDEASQMQVHARFFRSAFMYLAKHYGVSTARRTYHAIEQTMVFKSAILKSGVARRMGADQSVIRAGLLANKTFVMSDALSADPTPIVHTPSPAETPA